MLTETLSLEQEFYLLGLIWADGYVNDKRIELHGIYEDLKPLESIATQLLPKIYDRQRKHWKPSRMYYSYDKRLRLLFAEMKFRTKSVASPDFLKNETQARFFMRGFFDGDGSVNMSRGKCRQLNFSGSYYQDWTHVSSVFDQLEITYSISKHISKKKHKASMIRTCGRDNIRKFFEYIYPKGFDFGLKRKYDRFLEILE